MLLLCLAASVQIGCVAAVVGGAAGAGTVIYVKGQVEDNVNASTTAVYHAVIAALKELQMPVIGDEHDGLSVELKSRFADGKSAWIKVTSATTVSSKLAIRVGTFGDENRSRVLLTEIEKHLPKAN
jgi:hypothetical protein